MSSDVDIVLSDAPVRRWLDRCDLELSLTFRSGPLLLLQLLRHLIIISISP